MERIDRILHNEAFTKYLRMNEQAEQDRIFCRHGMEHFLDVARIGCILNYEKRLGIEKELIYAAALLHDIGRHVQYRDGTPHEKASAELAPQILEECGFKAAEREAVLEAIIRHRDTAAAVEANLNGLLYLADKASRPCFCCSVEEECNWKNENKNITIQV